jgi:hypothetical protein
MIQTKKENWKDIDGFDGYQISNLGRVKSFKWDKINGRIMKCGWRRGYRSIGLTTEDGQKLMSVHRLVANAFIPNTHNKETVNHINGIKTDNRAENLDWATDQENMNHALATGLHPNPRIAVIQYSKDGEFINEYESQIEAQRQTGIHNSNIGSVARGERITAGNYIWKFKNN